jgi:hypothetical protein
MREEGLLKLFFAEALPAAEAAEILRSMRQHRLAVLEQLQELEPKILAKEAPFPLMVLRGGIEFNQWFVEWCERMESQLLEPARQKRSS